MFSKRSSSRHRFLIQTAKALLALLFWVSIWQLLALSVGKELLVPYPATVLQALLVLTREPDFWATIFLSFLRVLLGFAVGALLGTVLACATSFSRIFDLLLTPAIGLVRTIPVVSFIILALIWIQTNLLPAVIAGLMVLPILWGNISEGIRSTDKNLLEMANIYHFGFWKTFRYVYLPSLRPHFFSACVTSLGIAWKSGIAAEVLCQPKLAIGTGLYYSKIYLETSNLFAWTIVVIIFSFIVERLFRRVFKKAEGHKT